MNGEKKAILVLKVSPQSIIINAFVYSHTLEQFIGVKPKSSEELLDDFLHYRTILQYKDALCGDVVNLE